MRLWHTSLFDILPKQQLVAQWRECSAIAGSIQKKGTPNHMLVNFVIDYPFDHFISYAYYLRQAMIRRGYRTMDSVWNKIVSLKPDYTLLPLEEVYTDEMDDFYLKACLWNLMEKVERGGITEEPYRTCIKETWEYNCK